MSYCVNCGVELEESIKKCPLCQTPVINPNDLNRLKEIQSPYPENKGEVEQVSKTDLIIFISVSLFCIVLSCIAINHLSYPAVKWWLLVAGFCGIIWTLTVPPLIAKNLKRRVFALCNGLMVAIYICLIGMFVDNFDWVVDLGLPITAIALLLIEIYLSISYITKSFIILGSTLLAETAMLCVSIDLLIDRATGKTLGADWSAIVSCVNILLIVILVTILSRKRLRAQLHRRFHL